MALTPFTRRDDIQFAQDSATRKVHLVKVSGRGEVTDLGPLNIGAVSNPTPAIGTVLLTDNPADGDAVGINDGINPAATFEFDDREGGVAATGTISLEDGLGDPGQPLDGDIVILNDGVNDPVTFEFDDDEPPEVAPGNVGVMIGLTPADTTANLIAAINEAEDLAVTASPADPPDHTCALVNDREGTIGNHDILINGATNIVVTGMEGGVDSYDLANIQVLLGNTAAATAENLRIAIAANLNIDAERVLALVSLTNRTQGTIGNHTILKDGAAITVTGMDGGTAGGSFPVTVEGLELPSSDVANEPGTSVLVGDVSIEALANNPARIGALFVNLSDNWIYLSLGGTAALETGIPLAPRADAKVAGGFYEINIWNLYKGAVNAISDNDESLLLVMEI